MTLLYFCQSSQDQILFVFCCLNALGQRTCSCSSRGHLLRIVRESVGYFSDISGKSNLVNQSLVRFLFRGRSESFGPFCNTPFFWRRVFRRLQGPYRLFSMDLYKLTPALTPNKWLYKLVPGIIINPYNKWSYNW